MARLQVLSVASEVYPLIKTGGLADVAGALPGALAGEGIAMRTLVPGYPAVTGALKRAQAVHAFDDLFGGPARLLAGKAAGLDLLVIDAPHLYARPGNPYLGADGRDWPDNAFRFAALARVAAALGRGLLPAYRPSVIHCHDWQAGLTPAYVAFGEGPAVPTVMTVHNLAFQGAFPADLLEALGLPPRAFTVDGVEYHGQIGFLKAGLRLADRITTVSPTYANEICSDEFGMGLQGLLRGRAERLQGILNGIDTAVWDPAADPLIPAPYDAADPASRAADKAALQAEMGLDEAPDTLLFAVISRLGWQKGLDLLLDALPLLIAEGAQLALLGSGDAALEAGFRAAADAHPGRIACRIGYDEGLAHRIQAGADALLVPSRFEPCGLTQLCALRYGAVPVVARVGGLADTVIDASPMALAAGAATGVMFSPVNQTMFEGALRRTAALYRQPATWSRLQANGMATDVSWHGPAQDYARLFRSLAPGAAPARRRAKA
ncbi:glycogen synthase GlgA [Sphingosinicella sp. BN140058]|uniref:glycogen synthase GlgA n=1 Tax=Sphingosinicella sp. BN140058 TaxID=1892855 RepID=UPI00101389AC|nr:glycogen synthase GlgA [Sphingosinicella sp. BN140058]QAY77604.1 glycogen synthase GlgA [Sphingosinicella sp. BN140058]